jgi:hypothetical protein
MLSATSPRVSTSSCTPRCRWDFIAAYLQGELLTDEVVWCYLPPGHEHKYPPGSVMKRSSSRSTAWRRPADASSAPHLPLAIFIEHGFTQAGSDDSVFM